MASRKIPTYAVISGLCIILFEIMLFMHVKWVMYYFYMLAWWPYIFFVDGIVKYRTGTSILTRSKRSLLSISIWSVTIWLIFEAYNLALKNWHYIDVVSNIWIRWSGYILAFATVLPGIFETYELLCAFNLAQNAENKPFKITKTIETALIITGILCLVLPVIFPRYTYPLVWGGFVFLLDPINRRLNGQSIISELSRGKPQKLIRILTSGIICGFLWEFWNYWAATKWIYTVPFVGHIKLFEMPVAGFLGFPPFAVECYCMYETLRLAGIAIDWENPPLKINNRWICSIAMQLPFWFCTFYLMDKFTVLSFH